MSKPLWEKLLLVLLLILLVEGIVSLAAWLAELSTKIF